MSATAQGLRIGEMARLAGTTPRTIRYYEEIGLLPPSTDRASGRHRLYTEQDVERLRDALRLKELLGVTLDELKQLLEAEEARAALRDEWRSGEAAARSSSRASGTWTGSCAWCAAAATRSPRWNASSPRSALGCGGG